MSRALYKQYFLIKYIFHETNNVKQCVSILEPNASAHEVLHRFRSSGSGILGIASHLHMQMSQNNAIERVCESFIVFFRCCQLVDNRNAALTHLDEAQRVR